MEEDMKIGDAVVYVNKEKGWREYFEWRSGIIIGPGSRGYSFSVDFGSVISTDTNQRLSHDCDGRLDGDTGLFCDMYELNILDIDASEEV